MGQTLADITAMLDGELVGDGTIVIERVAPLDEAAPDAITFLSDARKSRQLAATRAAAAIVPLPITHAPLPIVRVKSPEHALVILLSSWYPPPGPASEGLHPTASLASSVHLGAQVSLGPYTVIGDETIVNDTVRIGAGTVIGRGCRVGTGTLIYPRVTIYDGVIIGARVIIHSGAVIGSDGFGYVRNGRQAVKVPQVGGVVIGDDVEIGANTTIDRATLGTTRIGRGTKIDNLVQIGHNVVIGEDVTICAQVGIAGSTTVADGTVIGGQAGLADHIAVGENARIGGQSGVTKSVPRNTTVSGYPARPHQQARRVEAYISRLPEWAQRLEAIERQLKKSDQ